MIEIEAPKRAGRRTRAERAESIIGPRLRELRESRGMTQLEVAESVGVSRVMVTWWESGRTHIDADFLPAIAGALRVDPCAFYDCPYCVRP